MSLPVVFDDPSTPLLIEPNTGEVIPLSEAKTAHIADARDYIRELESQLREAKTILDGEVLSRMDADRKWTIKTGDWALTAPSPEPTVKYDAAALHAELEGLVADGVISGDAMARAVEEVVTYKARAAGVKALVKGGGEVAAVVAAHSREEEPIRRVSVKRAA